MRYLTIILLPIILFSSDKCFGKEEVHVTDSFQISVGDSITRYIKTYQVNNQGDTVFNLIIKRLPLAKSSPNSKNVKIWNVPGVGSLGEFGTPYNSTQHFNPKLALIISCTFLLFIGYIAYKVRKALKKDSEHEQ